MTHRLARMSSLSRDDVAHLAGLARIELSDAELDRMVGELGVILESVAKVQQAPTDGVAPMSHPMPLTNVTRPDVVRPTLGAEAALDCVLAGGEEHSLLATFPTGALPDGWRAIGGVRAPREGERAGILVDGRTVGHTGWDHFRDA